MAGRLVIDASAALHIALADRPTPELEAYLLHAPALFLSERTSSLASAAWRVGIPAADLREALRRLEAMPVQIIENTAEHRREALELAQRLGWAKTYDAEYVVIARGLVVRSRRTTASPGAGIWSTCSIRAPSQGGHS
jgi:predicted nucleic acid-binding protein